MENFTATDLRTKPKISRLVRLLKRGQNATITHYSKVIGVIKPPAKQ